MQVVGRDCAVCRKSIRTEIDGVGCESCALVLHDACAVVPGAYRDPSPPASEPGRGRPRAPHTTLCPTCQLDLRALKRARDREHHASRMATELARRAGATSHGARTGAAVAILILLRLVLGLIHDG